MRLKEGGVISSMAKVENQCILSKARTCLIHLDVCYTTGCPRPKAPDTKPQVKLLIYVNGNKKIHLPPRKQELQIKCRPSLNAFSPGRPPRPGLEGRGHLWVCNPALPCASHVPLAFTLCLIFPICIMGITAAPTSLGCDEELMRIPCLAQTP